MIIFPRGIPGRVLLTTAICAGLSVALVTCLLFYLMVKQSMGRIASLTPDLDPWMRQSCESAPQTFYKQLPPGQQVEIGFYDGTSLAPVVPGLGPIDAQLLGRIRAGESTAARVYLFDDWGGAAIRQTAKTGPCALTQIRWRVGRYERWQARLLLLGLPMLNGALAVAIASWFAVRPLTEKLHRLRKASEQIGQAAGYASAGESAPDDLGQLSRLLDQAHARIAKDTEHARERNKALEQHLANVAHDLRTPLASLQLTVERLSETINPTNQERVDSAATPNADLIREAIVDVLYMGELINNLHLACQLQDGGDPLQGDPLVDLSVLVENVVRRFRRLGRARGIEVQANQLGYPVWARCNPAMAEQVLQNLVHNAVAYGDEGGHVAVVLEASSASFLLTVVDDGPGVPPAELPRLGDRTFRSDSARQREPQGSGLGLAISGEICRRAGFALRFSQEAPRGLRATVSGPRIRQ